MMVEEFFSFETRTRDFILIALLLLTRTNKAPLAVHSFPLIVLEQFLIKLL